MCLNDRAQVLEHFDLPYTKCVQTQPCSRLIQLKSERAAWARDELERSNSRASGDSSPARAVYTKE